MREEKTFGSTTLNKILFYIDNQSYVERGKPISDFKYKKWEHGFIPKQLMQYKSEMKEAKILEEISVPYFGLLQSKPVSKITPNIDNFTSNDISIIDSVISEFKGVNASMASDRHHQLLCWKIARHGEDLPFYAYLITKSDEYTDEELQWVEDSIKRYEGKSIHNN